MRARDPVAEFHVLLDALKTDAAHQLRASGGTQVHEEMRQARIAGLGQVVPHRAARARQFAHAEMTLYGFVGNRIDEIVDIFRPAGP